MGGDLDEGWRPRRLQLAKSQRPLVFLCELIRPVFSSVFALWPVDFETRSLPIKVVESRSFSHNALNALAFYLFCSKRWLNLKNIFFFILS